MSFACFSIQFYSVLYNWGKVVSTWMHLWPNLKFWNFLDDQNLVSMIIHCLVVTPLLPSCDSFLSLFLLFYFFFWVSSSSQMPFCPIHFYRRLSVAANIIPWLLPCTRHTDKSQYQSITEYACILHNLKVYSLSTNAYYFRMKLRFSVYQTYYFFSLSCRTEMKSLSVFKW